MAYVPFFSHLPPRKSPKRRAREEGNSHLLTPRCPAQRSARVISFTAPGDLGAGTRQAVRSGVPAGAASPAPHRSASDSASGAAGGPGRRGRAASTTVRGTGHGTGPCSSATSPPTPRHASHDPTAPTPRRRPGPWTSPAQPASSPRRAADSKPRGGLREDLPAPHLPPRPPCSPRVRNARTRHGLGRRTLPAAIPTEPRPRAPQQRGFCGSQLPVRGHPKAPAA